MDPQVAAAEDAAGKSLVVESNDGADGTAGDSTASTSKLESSKPEAFNISNQDAVRRLRAKGQPIRLFAESDKERRLRLRALELIEERSEGQRNDFMRALEGMDKDMDLEELSKRANVVAAGNPLIEKLRQADSREPSSGPASESEKEEDDARDGEKEDLAHAQVDLSLVKKDQRKLYPQIYYGIKRMLKEWEQWMQERPG